MASEFPPIFCCPPVFSPLPVLSLHNWKRRNEPQQGPLPSAEAFLLLSASREMNSFLTLTESMELKNWQEVLPIRSSAPLLPVPIAV